jgi:hypothetical protein
MGKEKRLVGERFRQTVTVFVFQFLATSTDVYTPFIRNIEVLCNEVFNQARKKLKYL